MEYEEYIRQEEAAKKEKSSKRKAWLIFGGIALTNWHL